MNKTVANYEKVIKEKETIIVKQDNTIKDLTDKLRNTEAALKDLNDKYNKTVSDYEKVIKELEKTIKDLNDKFDKTVANYE